ncbi:hypothetical protein BHM03_00008802, partial [Ensete ventricosum]
LYNRKVQPRGVSDDDLVLKKAVVSDPGCTHGKLAPNCEGPYRVVRTIRDGTYVLDIMDGRVRLEMWYISNLKRFCV